MTDGAGVVASAVTLGSSELVATRAAVTPTSAMVKTTMIAKLIHIHLEAPACRVGGGRLWGDRHNRFGALLSTLRSPTDH